MPPMINQPTPNRPPAVAGKTQGLSEPQPCIDETLRAGSSKMAGAAPVSGLGSENTGVIAAAGQSFGQGLAGVAKPVLKPVATDGGGGGNVGSDGVPGFPGPTPPMTTKGGAKGGNVATRPRNPIAPMK